jgi:cystathionine beta-lyase/cystathionine gamma-synthase
LRRYECTLYDNSDAELDRLESDLKTNPTRYTALYIEFPGNPLLDSPNLIRIHALARRYGFAIILDDTIATSVNLDLLPYADVICTSLTKMFSGACNVMGGSIALNPKSPHYHAFSSKLETNRVDSYFPTDILIMAANSSDFPSRVRKANKSASIIATKLREHPQVLEVFYPEGSASKVLRRPQTREFRLRLPAVDQVRASQLCDSFLRRAGCGEGPVFGDEFHACLCVCLARACERAGVGREIWCCRAFGADQCCD